MGLMRKLSGSIVEKALTRPGFYSRLLYHPGQSHFIGGLQGPFSEVRVLISEKEREEDGEDKRYRETERERARERLIAKG